MHLQEIGSRQRLEKMQTNRNTHSITNRGSSVFDITAPMTVVIQGWRSFESCLISITKSALRFGCSLVLKNAVLTPHDELSGPLLNILEKFDMDPCRLLSDGRFDLRVILQLEVSVE